MNCEQSQQLLIEYIENELKSELARELESHLRECAECQTEHDALQATLSRASDNPIPQPDEHFWDAFPDQVLDSYKNQQQQTSEAITTEPASTGKSFLQTISDWLLPNGWPQLAAQALVLVIAIGGVVYWGFQPAAVRFNSAELQAQLSNGQNLAAIVKQHTYIVADSNTYSFRDTHAQTDFFKAGSLYSESLALLTGNDLKALQQHLQLLGHELTGLSVNQQLDKIKAAMAKGAIEQSNLLKAIAGLQPDLEKQATEHSENDRLLFQLGSWLNDIKLAAALENPELLRQAKTAEYLLEAMQKQNMPKGAITKLKQIIAIMQSSSLDSGDYVTAIQLINTVQQILG